MGIHEILDQAITPYPGTEMRRELLESGSVTNPYDFKWYNGYWSQVKTKHLSSKQLLFERWKARREILGLWYADGEFQRNYPNWAWFWNNILRRIIALNERRMLWMYGEKGRFKRQMMQWARINDFFGDMVIDESFFDLDEDGPDGIGDADASVDFGATPRGDRLTIEVSKGRPARRVKWEGPVAPSIAARASAPAEEPISKPAP
jgi:hypothetical protein